jgi:predicted TIM-barrel fold metal-dependent hydrolase
MISLLPVVFAFSLLFAQPQDGSTRGPAAGTAALDALAALDPIDTHTHVAQGDADFYAMLDRLHMRILDILLVDDKEDYRKSLNGQRRDAEAVIAASHGHVVLCTSFDPFQFSNADFPAPAIQSMNEDFAKGAVAVKIWKNVGMELKDKQGRYVLADNPKFESIYRDIQEHDRTLIAHQAEPDAAWQPPNPHALDYSYYSENPFWYMYDKPQAPKKQQILDARDHLLAENPNLRVVGAHLGSLEDDLDGLAGRLDRYPNFAVDTAARVPHLAVMPGDRVRSFILKYQDRIVYATDLGFAKNESSADVIKEWQEQYARDWRYFSTRDRFTYDGHETQGVGLPPEVLRKLYHENAVRWFPGILKK